MKVLISGKGGDGAKFLSLLIAKTALEHGMNAKFIEAYGPEARGGISKGFVTFDSKPIGSPVFKKADILIAFNESDLKYETIETIYIPERKHKNHNVFLFGIFAKKISFDKEKCLNVMKKIVEEKGYKLEIVETNKKTFLEGYL